MRSASAGAGEVLEHKAHKNMVEGPGREGDIENIRPAEFHIVQSGGGDSPFGLGDGRLGNINGRDPGPGAVGREREGLRPDAAARLEHARARRINCVAMQQANQGGSLVLQTDILARIIAVNIFVLHDLFFPFAFRKRGITSET